jgi:hypothetical protein
MWPREITSQSAGIFVIHAMSQQCLVQQIDVFEDLGCTFGRILALAVPALSKTTDGEAGTMLVKRS